MKDEILELGIEYYVNRTGVNYMTNLTVVCVPDPEPVSVSDSPLTYRPTRVREVSAHEIITYLYWRLKEAESAFFRIKCGFSHKGTDRMDFKDIGEATKAFIEEAMAMKRRIDQEVKK